MNKKLFFALNLAVLLILPLVFSGFIGAEQDEVRIDGPELIDVSEHVFGQKPRGDEGDLTTEKSSEQSEQEDEVESDDLGLIVPQQGAKNGRQGEFDILSGAAGTISEADIETGLMFPTQKVSFKNWLDRHLSSATAACVGAASVLSLFGLARHFSGTGTGGGFARAVDSVLYPISISGTVAHCCWSLLEVYRVENEKE